MEGLEGVCVGSGVVQQHVNTGTIVSPFCFSLPLPGFRFQFFSLLFISLFYFYFFVIFSVFSFISVFRFSFFSVVCLSLSRPVMPCLPLLCAV